MFTLETNRMDIPLTAIILYVIDTKHNNENLFLLDKDSNLIGLWNTDDQFCECPASIKEANKFKCSPSSSVTCKRNVHYDSIGSSTCIARPERRKRSLEYPWKSLEKHRRRRSAKVLHADDNVTMTADEAMKYCQKTIGDAAIFKACSQIPNVQGQASLENCALDIQLSHSLVWTRATMESLKSSCFSETIDNNTLEEEQSDGGQSIAEFIRNILCPGLPECSGNGFCENGTCICNDEYTASDCSIDKKIPPEIFGVRGDGICDLNEIACDTGFVLGDDIGISPDLSCNISKYHISRTGTKTLITSWIANGKLETILEVHCPLNELNGTRHKRDTVDNSEKFMEMIGLSISYDRQNFGKVFDLVIFDSKCQLVLDPDSNPPQVALKKSTCFIGGKCYLDGEQSGNEICRVCNPLAPYSWSIPSSVAGCVKVDHGKTLSWVAGPIIGAVVTLAITVGIFLIYQKRARARVKEIPPVK